MDCGECGHRNPAEYAFCEECGGSLRAVESCTACGHANPADHLFCEECGGVLAAREVAAAATEPTTDQPDEPSPPSTCSDCGHANPADFTFCEECGLPLAVLPAIAAAVPVGGAVTGPRQGRPPSRGSTAEKPAESGAAAKSPGRTRAVWGSIAAVAIGGIVAGVVLGGNGGNGSSGGYAVETTGAPVTTASGTVTTAAPAPTTGTPATTTAVDAPSSTDTPPTSVGGEDSVPVDLTLTPAEEAAWVDAISDLNNPSISPPPVSTITYGLVGTSESATSDRDFDGLSDFLENWLIETFKPYYIFDEEETDCLDPTTDMIVLFQVSPATTPSGYLDTSTRVVITVVASYKADCGMMSLSSYGFPKWLTHSHNGDNERIAINVYRSSATSDDWQIDYIEVNRHYDQPMQMRWGWGPEIPTPKNSDDWWSAMQTLGGNNRFLYLHDWASTNPCCHPVLYVSESKHAAFPSWAACEFYSSKIPVKVINEYNPINWFDDLLNKGIGWCTDKRIDLGGWTSKYIANLTQTGRILLEDCGGGDQFLPETPPTRNVGEINSPAMLGVPRQAFDEMSLSDDPVVRGMFGFGEYAWSDVGFCGGGWLPLDGCAGSMRGKWKVTSPVSLSPQGGEPTSITGSVAVTISNLTAQGEVWSGGEAGVEISYDLTVGNQGQGLDLYSEVLLYDDDGEPVLGPSGVIRDGVWLTTVAGWTETRWTGLSVWFPNSSFHPGIDWYTALVSVRWEPEGEIGSRYSSEFSVTNAEPGRLDGTWSCTNPWIGLVIETLDPSTYTAFDSTTGNEYTMRVTGHDVFELEWAYFVGGGNFETGTAYVETTQYSGETATEIHVPIGMGGGKFDGMTCQRT